jgi:hypothetical protein
MTSTSPRAHARAQLRLRQHGIALPVMLIVLTVMLIGTILLLKATNSTTLTTSNLAYQASLGKSADLGLMTAADWLTLTAGTNKPALDADDATKGYLATYNTAQTSADAAFWVGSRILPVDASGNTIEYVVHRMCALQGAYNQIGPPPNSCMQTTAKTQGGTSQQYGQSGASGASVFKQPPQVHYVITARISGPRGGNVVNQLVVTIGV